MPATAKKPAASEPILRFAQPAEWDAWLAKHHHSEGGVLVAIGKKGARDPAISYAEALEVALAWGWIDGQKQKLDEDVWLQRFSRRRAKSPWSKVNRQKAEALIKAGAMQPPGLAEVERAKQDGRWEQAYDSARSSTVPDDLAAALAANRKANALFAELDSANRYAILYRVQTAKKPETRQRRITEFVAMLARGETLHPRKKAAKG